MTNSSHDLEVGDVIQVLQIVREGAITHERAIPARITSINIHGYIEVQATRGAFDEEGHTRMALSRHDKGRTWR